MEQRLHKLPAGWKWRTVKELSHKVQYGHTTKAKPSGNAKFLRITDIQHGNIDWDKVPFVSISSKDLAKYKLQTNDLVFARSGATSGKSILIKNSPANAIFASYLIRVIPSCKVILPEFLALFFQSPAYWQQVEASASGAAQPNINGTKLSNFNVPLPSVDRQEKIVGKLNTLITRINTAIDHLQDNLKFSKDLFASALVDSFRSNSAWRACTVKDAFRVINGRAYKKAELFDSGKYHVVRIQNLKGGKSYYYSNLELNEDKYCSRGDLLFSWSGTPGTSFGAFIWDGDKSIYHYHIWKLELLVELDIRFAYWLLHDLTEEAISKSRGVAGMLHITKGMMESFEIALPPLIEQQKIATRLDALSERTSAIKTAMEEKIRDLVALKSSILDSAFRGQL